jgi:hypothetical protein
VLLRRIRSLLGTRCAPGLDDLRARCRTGRGRPHPWTKRAGVAPRLGLLLVACCECGQGSGAARPARWLTRLSAGALEALGVVQRSEQFEQGGGASIGAIHATCSFHSIANVCQSAVSGSANSCDRDSRGSFSIPRINGPRADDHRQPRQRSHRPRAEPRQLVIRDLKNQALAHFPSGHFYAARPGR